MGRCPTPHTRHVAGHRFYDHVPDLLLRQPAQRKNARFLYAVFKKMKREPLSTGLQGLTTTVDGRLIVSVDGLVDEPSTKSEEKTAEVDGQNRLYEILERELQAKNL